jgi:hypothetical protein
VLRNLARFPNLTALHIEFAVNTFPRDDEAGDGQDIPINRLFPNVSTAFDSNATARVMASSKYAFQRVIFYTYEALAANGVVPSLTHLAMHRLLPFANCEAWASHAWQGLLSTVRTFEADWARWISPPNASGHRTWLARSSTFRWFVQAFRAHVLMQLPAVERVVLRWNDTALPEPDMSLVPVPESRAPEERARVLAQHFPRLRELELEGCDPGGYGLVLLTAPQLRRLVLRDCVCIPLTPGRTWRDEGYKSTWAQVFKTFIDAQMPQLREFVFEDRLISRWMAEGETQGSLLSNKTLQQIRRIAPPDRVFPYVTNRLSTGPMYADEEVYTCRYHPRTLQRTGMGQVALGAAEDTAALQAFENLVHSNLQNRRIND